MWCPFSISNMIWTCNLVVSTFQPCYELVLPFCKILLLIPISLALLISHFSYLFHVFTIYTLRKCCKGVYASLPTSFFSICLPCLKTSICPGYVTGYLLLMCNDHCLLLFSPAIWVFIWLVIHPMTEKTKLSHNLDILIFWGLFFPSFSFNNNLNCWVRGEYIKQGGRVNGWRRLWKSGRRWKKSPSKASSEVAGESPDKISTTEVRAMLYRAGRITDDFLPKDWSSDRPRGFAFVRFVTCREPERAMEMATGGSWGGRKIHVNLAKS